MKFGGILAIVLFDVALACAVAGQVQRPARPDSIRTENSEQTNVGSIRGRVLMPEGAPFQGAARLTLQSMNGGQYVIFTDYQGQFNFSGLIPGNYVLEVDADRQRFEPVSQSIQVFRGMPSVVSVGLKNRAGARGAVTTGTVISVAELDKNIPEKARKEFRRGSDAVGAGKVEEAIGHYRKALAIYPDFLMARNDLGVQLMAAGRLDEAAEQLRLAVKLDGKAFNPQLNLGIVLVQQQQFAAAAQVLGGAVTLNPQSPAARLYAGQAYAGAGDSDRAEKELKLAFERGGSDFAIALFHLGNLYMGRGERAQALKSFEAYLAIAPGAANAGEARKLIGLLR